jgi:hypothetical protein
VTNGGFQNHLHLIYGLPNGFIGARSNDTSDILDKGLKRSKKQKTEEQLLEEFLAAQILAGRQKEALAAKKVAEKLLKGHNLVAEEKANRTRLLLLFMLMDD